MELAVAQRLANSRLWRSIMTPLSNWYMNAAGYRQYGLRFDDIRMEETPEMQEALRRLSPRDNDERQYRYKLAMQRSIMHNPLPKDQWTTDATDIEYVRPILDEVLSEKKERKAFDVPDKNAFGNL